MIDSPQPQRIAIVRALPGLGDLLCVVPALRALRATLPCAKVSLIGLPAARELVFRFGYLLDDLIEFPGFPGIAERNFEPPRFLDFIGRMHKLDFDLAIQMHGSGITSNPFTVLLGAKHNAGYYLPGNYCPDTSRFLLFDEQESEVRRYIRLMEHLGVPLQGEELAFPLWHEDFVRLAEIEETHDLRPGGYICVHPGAKDPARRWPPEHFAQLADRLADRGLQVVLTGTEGERPLTHAVAQQMKAHVVDLAGRTDLGALAALLGRARLLVCNDTGVSHLAAALRVPSVVVFTTTDPARWAPLDGERHRVVMGDEGPAEGISQARHLLAHFDYSLSAVN